MLRPRHPAPLLSPATAKQLIAAFSHDVNAQPPSHHRSHCRAQSPTSSPDSAYSSDSPTMPDQEFEYDLQDDAGGPEQHDAEDYESLMEESGAWDTPAWGRWPESNGAGPGWSRGPIGSASGQGRNGSIISLSPRGSFSASPKASRKTSMTQNKAFSQLSARRDSDPSLLGFNLVSQRRRSSARSLTSRRRSIAFSPVDSQEDVRLRTMASMDMLGRRFSEVVEVTVTAGSDESSQSDCVSTRSDASAMAREGVSEWSPWTVSTMDSELHTAPYLPTPVMPTPARVVLSNYPLASAANEDDMGSPSEYSLPPSPMYVARVAHRSEGARGAHSAHMHMSTPPAPVEPAMLVREMTRPTFVRASTDYQFPATSRGVPPGATAPPPFGRSLSNPLFSAAAASQVAVASLEQRATRSFGSFPVARPAPLGVSPLRETTRRQSVVSEASSSRRPSLASAADASIGSFRRAPRDAAPRRKSTDLRKSSLVSLAGSRKNSVPSLTILADARRMSALTRKSSVVSISEYGYLAPEIVIDAPATTVVNTTLSLAPPSLVRPNIPPPLSLPSFNLMAATPTPTPNTPSKFNPMNSFFGKDSVFTLSPRLHTLTDNSPRSSRASSVGSTGSPSPSPSVGSEPSHSSLSIPQTPKSPKSPRSVMDRGRPISPGELWDYSIPRVARAVSSPHSLSAEPVSPTSSSSSQVIGCFNSPSPSDSHVHEHSHAQLRPGVARKAVPQLSQRDFDLVVREDETARRGQGEAERAFDRRGATSSMKPGSSSPLASGGGGPPRDPAGHRRAISVEQNTALTFRPPNRRQATLPPLLDQLSICRPQLVTFASTPTVFDGVPESSASSRPRSTSILTTAPSRMSVSTSANYSPASSSSGPSSGVTGSAAGSGLSTSIAALPIEGRTKSMLKRSSVTFTETALRPGMGRASSFSRFFHSKTKSQSQVSAPAAGSGGPSASARPVSMDSHLMAHALRSADK